MTFIITAKSKLEKTKIVIEAKDASQARFKALKQLNKKIIRKEKKWGISTIFLESV